MNGWDKEDPLRRIEGETVRANQALKDYASLGAGRTVNKLLDKYKNHVIVGENPPSRNYMVMARWSTKYFWLDRVGAWQDLQQKEAQTFNAARYEAMQQRVLTLGEALMKKAEEMIKWPIEKEEQEISSDGHTIIIKKYPAKWEFTTPAQFVKVTHELFALINGKPTAIHKFDLDKMNDDQLREYLGKNARRGLEAVRESLEGSGTPGNESSGDPESDPESSTVH